MEKHQVIQRKRIWWGLALVGVAAVGGLWWSHHLHQEGPASADSKDSSPWSLWPSQMPNAAPTLGAAPTPGATPPEAVRDPSPLDTMQPPVFRADSKGDLVIDTQTKDDVERVYALYHGDEAQRKLAAFSARIPDKARRQLNDLYQNYSQYAQALAQAIPPAQQDASIDDIKPQLAIMSDLQDKVFGRERAAAMFGHDREVMQSLTDSITNNTSGASLQEKANKAQEDMSKADGMHPSGQSGSGAGGFAGGGGGGGISPLIQGAPKGTGR